MKRTISSEDILIATEPNASTDPVKRIRANRQDEGLGSVLQPAAENNLIAKAFSYPVPSAHSNPSCFMETVPNEVLFCILRFLSHETLATSASRVCKRWKELIYLNLLTKVDFCTNSRWAKYHDSLSVIRYPNLQCLVLRKCNWVGDKELGYLVRFAPTLRILDLSGCGEITDQGLQMHISKLTNLRTLLFGAKEQNRLKPATVHFCDGITDAGLASLSTLVHLRELSLIRCKINGSSFAQLATLTNLAELDLEWTRITDSSLEMLSQWTSLQSLSLNNCRKITDLGIRQHVSKLSNLKNISFICTNISDETLHQLSHLPIQRLSIYYSPNITDVGFYWISKMTHLFKFKYENIEEKNSKLTDAGFGLLSKLPNLSILKLCGLTEVSYTTLRDLSSLRNLRLLDRMKESRFKFLPKSLKQLHLSGHPSVTDEALKHLLYLNNLHKLRLSDFSSITPAGLPCFNAITSLKIIRISWCDQINVTGAKEALRDFIDNGGKLEIAYDDDEWNLIK